MTSLHFALLAAACASAALLATAPDARACSMAPPEGSITELPSVNGNVPLDGPIAFAAGLHSGPFEVTVADEDGTAIAVTEAASPDPRLRWIRAQSGTFPEGRLSLVVRAAGKVVLEGGVRATGTIADYRLHIARPRLGAEISGDESASKIRCRRSGSDSCGDLGDIELESRWRRAPVLSFTDHDLGWVKTVFTANNRWTVRHADGTVSDEGFSLFTSHTFASVGVEYCVESTRTPLPGVEASPQTERLCVQDDGAQFAWSDAENDAVLVEKSNDLGCESLDFPDGVDVPEPLEDKASGGGCSVGARSRGDWWSALGLAFAVYAGGVAARRRSRRR